MEQGASFEVPTSSADYRRNIFQFCGRFDVLAILGRTHEVKYAQGNDPHQRTGDRTLWCAQPKPELRAVHAGCSLFFGPER
jgi:hypothetical protein